MRAATLASLAAAGLAAADIERVVRQALAEDVGGDGEDLTSVATIPAGSRSLGDFVVRGAGVIAGLPVLAATLELGIGDDVEYELIAQDGDLVARGTVVATVAGPTRALLQTERVALNLLCRLSGIATATHAWVEQLAGTNARVRDTRKTTPGLRQLEKYAVRCGGGVNHRAGLHDAVLVKDNHVLAAGGVGAALAAVHAHLGDRQVVVQTEIDRLDQLDEALDHGATQILLDNMSLDELREAVARTRARAPGVLLEASGGLTLELAREVGETGVDLIAVGAITHSAGILDIALDLRTPQMP